MIDIALKGERETLARLQKLPATARVSLARPLERLRRILQKKAQENELSRAVPSISSSVLRSSVMLRFWRSVVVGPRVGSDANYARFREFPRPIRPKRAPALPFGLGAETVLGRRHAHPPLPGHSFLDTALREVKPEVREQFAASFMAALKP
jgi:hypothetical protein